MHIGQIVRVKAPFSSEFPGEHVVAEAYFADSAEGPIEQCRLEGVEPHFAAAHLEVVE